LGESYTLPKSRIPGFPNKIFTPYFQSFHIKTAVSKPNWNTPILGLSNRKDSYTNEVTCP